MVERRLNDSNCSTNLTEKQLQFIENIVEPQENTEKTLREIVNGILY